MKILILVFILNILLPPAYGGEVIQCSHTELCKMVQLIAIENNISDIKTQTLVNISGDPHEFEPSIAEIKSLISATVLLTGPHELNPWIKKISGQRSKFKELITINLPLGSREFNFYLNSNTEALAHFWLYPRIYCSLKSKLENELIKLNYKIKKQNTCDFRAAEQELQKALSRITIPIILTHDALLPLVLTLVPHKTQSIIALKGSGHHEEASPKSIKNMYDGLKSPKVLWIEETGINIPTNILNKIRPNDLIIKLDTAKTQSHKPFSVLTELTDKLNQLPVK